jgi:hypothetical protein
MTGWRDTRHMRFFVHSGEATQAVVERHDSATLALEAVSVINQAAPNIRVFSTNMASR